VHTWWWYLEVWAEEELCIQWEGVGMGFPTHKMYRVLDKRFCLAEAQIEILPHLQLGLGLGLDEREKVIQVVTPKRVDVFDLF
jgi:hypothetical protein